MPKFYPFQLNCSNIIPSTGKRPEHLSPQHFHSTDPNRALAAAKIQASARVSLQIIFVHPFSAIANAYLGNSRVGVTGKAIRNG